MCRCNIVQYCSSQGVHACFLCLGPAPLPRAPTDSCSGPRLNLKSWLLSISFFLCLPSSTNDQLIKHFHHLLTRCRTTQHTQI